MDRGVREPFRGEGAFDGGLLVVEVAPEDDLAVVGGCVGADDPHEFGDTGGHRATLLRCGLLQPQQDAAHKVALPVAVDGQVVGEVGVNLVPLHVQGRQVVAVSRTPDVRGRL